MGFQKNVASQKWLVFAFDRTDNTPKTGDAAQITAKVRKDYGTAPAVGDTNPTEVEDGYYEFDLTQAETNADVLDLLPESSTSDIQVIGVPGRVFTQPANFSALSIESGGDLTDTTVNGKLDTIDNFLDTEVAAILADTDELQTDLADGGRLDLLIDSIVSKVDVIDGICDDILVDTAVIGAGGAGLTAVPWNSAWDTEVQSECADALTAYDAPTKTELDAAHATTDGLITAVDDFVDTEIAAIKTVVDAILADTGTDGVVLSAATQQAIADAVLIRGMSNTEDTADNYSLTTLVMAAFESSVSGTAWTIKKTDGTTLLARTLTVDATADPVVGVT